MRRLSLVWMGTWILQLACDAAGQAVVNATTQGDLMRAFGDPAVSTIVMLADIVLTDDWVVHGVAPGSRLYVLTRNLTIMGTYAPVVGSSWYPILDATEITTSRIFIAEGAELTFHHIMLARLGPFGSIVVGRGGFNIVYIAGSSPGTFHQHDSVLIYPYCPPLLDALASWKKIPRLARMPGNQTVQILPSGWCQVPPPGAEFSGQCFPIAFELVDIAYVLESLRTKPNLTSPWPLQQLADNLVILCNQLTVTVKPPPPGPPPVSSPSSSPSVGLVVGAAVGGAAVLLLLLGAAVLCIRRRRMPAPDAVDTITSCKNSVAYLFDDARKVSEEKCLAGCPESDESHATPDYCNSGDQAAANRDRAQSSTVPPDYVNELHEISRNMQTSISDQQLHIEAVIGSGAYGTVYRGSWQGLQVAIKTLMFSSHTVGGCVGQAHGVLTEAALSKSISHPNVVATYSCELQPVPVGGSSALDFNINDKDKVVMDWRLYIIQEYCDGGSLKEALLASCDAQTSGSGTGLGAPGPKISFTQMTAFELAFDIACGMCHLHERNVIHGDLNPANVLLKQRDSGRWSPKVCDFGLSVHLTDNRSHISNLRRGTPFYVAPEVLECGTMSRAADVYSMGVMLWELYMGRTVWQVSDHDECELCAAFPRLPLNAPPSYLALLKECLRLDARQRPTFVEIMDRLLQLCTGATVCQGHGVGHPFPGVAAGAALFG